MMNIWLGDPEAYFFGKKAVNPVKQILGIRRMEHADLVCMERLMRPETSDIFGDVDLGRIYEESCLSVVQCNEDHDVISGLCLCNYPNVPAVPQDDWLNWLYTLYSEEDNDDVVPIIDAETNLLKEFYGEYYVSEMVRYPDNSRRLIVSENDEGLATGVMFLNSHIDVDSLNDNFEIGPYNGLRKIQESDRFPDGCMEPASVTFFPIFSRKPKEELSESGIEKKALSDDSVEGKHDRLTSVPSVSLIDNRFTKRRISMDIPKAPDSSQMTFLSELPSLSDYFDAYYKAKMMTSAFLDSMFDIPRQTGVTITESSKSLSLEDVHLPSRPIYYGQPNAFVLEIFATKDDIKRRWSKNFIEAAFECFPDVDYCAILLPSLHPYLPFLEHFVRVPFKCNRDYPMTLYITHRAAHLGQVKLQEAKPSDREQLEELFLRIPKTEQILLDFDEAVKLDRRDLYCYVFLWNDLIIGVVILCLEKEKTCIRRRFHVDDYIVNESIRGDAYGRILHFVLMPIFSVHLHYFFCEIMRFTGMTVLYYRLHRSGLSALTRNHPLTLCLNNMVPLKPRNKIEYRYRGFVETDEPEEKTEPFSLFMTSPRLAMIPNTIVDMKIVIVGASDTGVAFAESLAFGQNFMHFANLTLISPHGLPFDSDHDEIVRRMVPFRGRYCREYFQRVPTRAWINIVYGTVISIHRKEKFVAVLNQGSIAYDYLILTCGLQYQRPHFIEESRRIGEEEEIPWNCLIINDDSEAASAIEKLRTLTNELNDEKRIIFYGHNIDCYCVLQGLLEYGLKGSWITLIQPPLPQCDSHESTFFNDCEVCVEVMNSITKNDIEILVGWEVIDWSVRDCTEGKMIESIVIRSKGKTKTMTCDVFFAFHEKSINMKTFLAICKSGLVFDGNLVIDPNFRTNDPLIFAAGTITKYCRKFYADSWQHGYFDSIEIGERMAKIIRTFIDNEHRGVVETFEAFKGKTYLAIPVFRGPKIVACTFPGGYNYLHVCKPGKAMQRQFAIRFDIYGQVYVTGSCTSDIGYFRIRLNRLDAVESLTCFTKKTFEMHHMVLLYGKHESLLNELKTRFDNSLIVDFFAYFREPWAMAIFYDRFECLQVENRATLLSKTAIPGHSLIDDCTRALTKSQWRALNKDDRQTIQTRFGGSVYQQELEENLINFLEFCEDDLPVYCTPGKLRELYADVENSPLYNEI